MASRFKYNTSRLFNFAQGSYLERTSRPIHALIFLLPFIVFYEMGTILSSADTLNRAQNRVVAFIWLQSFLDKYVGLGAKLAWVAPPVAVVLILLAQQLASRKAWQFDPTDFGSMAIECILLAVPLILLSMFLSGPVQRTGDIAQPAYSTIQMAPPEGAFASSNVRSLPAIRRAGESLLASIVTGIGAGIYEELIFRLILMCLLMVLFQDLMELSHSGSITLSVLISAALFSAHHYVIFVNGQLTSSSPFSWREFVFRTIAGIYFAVLFAIRGFGITAGTHAFYDIMATLINAAFFQY